MYQAAVWLLPPQEEANPQTGMCLTRIIASGFRRVRLGNVGYALDFLYLLPDMAKRAL